MERNSGWRQWVDKAVGVNSERSRQWKDGDCNWRRQREECMQKTMGEGRDSRRECKQFVKDAVRGGQWVKAG